ncbi:13356_t:CDS:1 [Ambispora gerdemannii]|uniref:13356_t:CDS:1 n=1 Tax=Ambispora gerdemannii TaxID=144530 RepID=A0A9N8ZFZ9_9GLOM|nr:13356_t:CDS:1 [Ambispora gerdemannii]
MSYLNIYIFALFFNFLFVSLIGVPSKYEIHTTNVKAFTKVNNNFKVSIIHADGQLKLIKSIDENSILDSQFSVYYQNNDDFIDITFYDITYLKYENSCLLHYYQRFASIKISSFEGREFWPGSEHFSLGDEPEDLVEINLRNCRFIVGALNQLVNDPDNAYIKDFVMEYVKLGDSYTFYVRPGWKFESDVL